VNFILLVLGIMFIAAAVTLVVLMVMDEPPGIEPYEQETLDDFGDPDATQQTMG
jgi:hypothetical protein